MNANPTQLNSLPPPPKGQTGMTLQQLAPAPQGQKGLTLEQVISQQQAGQQQPGFLQGAGQDIQQRAENLRPSIENAGGNFSKIPELALNIAGQGAGAIGDIVNRGMSAIAPKTMGAVNDLGGQLVHKFQNTSIGKDVTDLAGQMQLKHPQLARDLSSAGTLAMNAPVIAGGANLAEKGLSVGKDLVSTANEGAGKVLSGAKEAIKPSLTPEEATKQIIQSETKDMPASKRTFEALKDTSGIKTHVDLSKAIDEQIIKPGLRSVDAEFAKNPTPHKLSDFNSTVGEGKSAVKVNHVKDAMKQLYDFYSKTGDAQGMSDMKALANKVKTTGLTYQDVNNLAREHGGTIKAFNANGEASSGLSKQAAENTRTGLKNTARNGLGSPEAKILDKQVSEAIKTKGLIDDQVEKVSASAQKNPKVGVIPKAIGPVVKAIGHPVDTLSRMTGVSGSGVSYNPTELEGRMPGNLKAIRGENGFKLKAGMSIEPIKGAFVDGESGAVKNLKERISKALTGKSLHSNSEKLIEIFQKLGDKKIVASVIDEANALLKGK